MEIEIFDNEGRKINQLVQWDINRILKIKNTNLKIAPMIHFYNDNSYRALVVKSEIVDNDVVVKVPNLLTQECINLNIAIFVDLAEKEAKTIDILTLEIEPKRKPEDYTYEENIEYINWVELDKQAKEKYQEMQKAVNEINQKLENGEFIGNGIEKIEKIGTEGLIDIYRIYYTDKSTFDYFVTNGATGENIINDKKPSNTTVYSSNKIEELLKFPQYNTMVVTAMQEGQGFKSDYSANEIKRQADGGGVVILRFNAPDGSGEQSYNYETYIQGYAIFRRAIVDEKNNTVTRIIIKIDNRKNVTKEEEVIKVATSQDLANVNQEIDMLTGEVSDNAKEIGLLKTEQTLQNSAIEKNSTGIQNLEHDKLGLIRYTVATDKVSQLEATEIISNYGNYEGQIIEFLTNGELPNKTISYGYLMTDKEGNQFLNVLNINGTITQFNKTYFEKHNFETYSYINEMIDLDNLTIDIRGEAPFIASVQNAINRPFKEETSIKGIIVVLAYSIEQQIQIYKDMETNKNYYRIITGKADKHSFSIWKKVESGEKIKVDTEMSDISINAVQNKVIKQYVDSKLGNINTILSTLTNVGGV